MKARRPLHILLAEDHPVNQKLALRLLQKWGHTVDVVGNGREALAALEQQQYDLLLMDVQMPEMGGFEATAGVRERESGESHLPIVAMTAHAMKGDRERCLEAGMDGYVSKPIQPLEMFQAIEAATAHLPAAPAEVRSLDRTGLFERVQGDTELLRELVRMFAEAYPRQLSGLREALAQGDGPAVARFAHALKGSVGNFSAPRAVHTAERLEEVGRAGDIAGAAGLVAELEAELKRLEPALWGMAGGPDAAPEPQAASSPSTT
jgi:CheY-like chemotaxis protein/HPt (histidine-containing phosphotransfer) domain-containing protein